MSDENMLESFDANGYTVKIYQDPDATSPFDFMTMLGEVAGFVRPRNYHNSFTDYHGVKSLDPTDFDRPCEICDGAATYWETESNTEEDCPNCNGDGVFIVTTIGELCDAIKVNDDATFVLPLRDVGHSDILPAVDINFSRDDEISNYIGVIYDTPQGRRDMGCKGEEIKDALIAEIRMFRQYLEDDIYGYVISSDDDDHLDSCWGFYGMKECIEAGEEAANGLSSPDDEDRIDSLDCGDTPTSE